MTKFLFSFSAFLITTTIPAISAQNKQMMGFLRPIQKKFAPVSPANCGLTIYRYSQDEQRLVLEDYNRVYYDQDRLLTTEPERDINCY